jgi:hypothetical protein
VSSVCVLPSSAEKIQDNTAKVANDYQCIARDIWLKQRSLNAGGPEGIGSLILQFQLSQIIAEKFFEVIQALPSGKADALYQAGRYEDLQRESPYFEPED